MNTTITAAVATERRSDLVAAAKANRTVRTARKWFARNSLLAGSGHSGGGHNSRYINQHRQAEDRWQTLYGLAAVTGR